MSISSNAGASAELEWILKRVVDIESEECEKRKQEKISCLREKIEDSIKAAEGGWL